MECGMVKLFHILMELCTHYSDILRISYTLQYFRNTKKRGKVTFILYSKIHNKILHLNFFSNLFVKIMIIRYKKLATNLFRLQSLKKVFWCIIITTTCQGNNYNHKEPSKENSGQDTKNTRNI